MSSPEEFAEPTTLSPDAAFERLGNEARIKILRTLGEADGPLSFTEVRDRVAIIFVLGPIDDLVHTAGVYYVVGIFSPRCSVVSV